MPSEKPEVAEISAKITGGGSDWSPEGLRFEMAVNSFPVVKGVIAETKGDESVKAPVSQEVIDRIGSLQAARLEGRTEPDFAVEASDGIGGNISYEGFISAPVLELTRVSTTDSISSVGRAALLDALDLSIYKANAPVARRETDTGLKALLPAQDGNVPGTIQAVTDILVGNYDRALEEETNDVMKGLLELQHGINNNGPLKIWKEILEANDVQYESWPEAFEKCPPIADTLAENVKRMLMSATPGFWNRARAIMADFQMFYVPQFDGLGFFERGDKRADETEGELELSVSGFSVGDGSPRILQPGGVVMLGKGAQTARRETSQNPAIPRVAAFAPNPLLQGFIQKEAVPFWLLRPTGVPIFGSEVEEDTGGSGEVNLKLDARVKRQEKGLEYNKEVELVSAGVMTELCEVMFKDLQLAHSTASATVPLDFSLNENVGKRVKVTINSKDGAGGKFDAFVHGISHSVDLRRGKQMNSYTRLNFTHAKYGGE